MHPVGSANIVKQSKWAGMNIDESLEAQSTTEIKMRSMFGAEATFCSTKKIV